MWLLFKGIFLYVWKRMVKGMGVIIHEKALRESEKYCSVNGSALIQSFYMLLFSAPSTPLFQANSLLRTDFLTTKARDARDSVYLRETVTHR